MARLTEWQKLVRKHRGNIQAAKRAYNRRSGKTASRWKGSRRKARTSKAGSYKKTWRELNRRERQAALTLKRVQAARAKLKARRENRTMRKKASKGLFSFLGTKKHRAGRASKREAARLASYGSGWEGIAAAEAADNAKFNDRDGRRRRKKGRKGGRKKARRGAWSRGRKSWSRKSARRSTGRKASRKGKKSARKGKKSVRRSSGRRGGWGKKRSTRKGRKLSAATKRKISKGVRRSWKRRGGRKAARRGGRKTSRKSARRGGWGKRSRKSSRRSSRRRSSRSF